MQTIKLCACVAFCYELDLAAVRPADHDLDPPNVALAQAPQLAQFLSHLMPEGIAGGDAVDLVFEDAVKPCDHAEVAACPQARCAPRRCIRSATVRTRCFCTS
jgi:hypothetical protein